MATVHSAGPHHHRRCCIEIENPYGRLSLLLPFKNRRRAPGRPFGPVLTIERRHSVYRGACLASFLANNDIGALTGNFF